MKRNLSDNNLLQQDASSGSMSRSQYILAKHIPTHNPLAILQPEGLGMSNKPKELPVEQQALITPPKHERNVMSGNSSFKNVKGSAPDDTESLKTEHMNLTRSLLEKMKENSDLKQMLEKALGNSKKDRDNNAEVKCMLFMIEVERLHTILFEQSKEIEDWKNRYMALEGEHMEQLGKLKIQFDNFKANSTVPDSEGLSEKMNAYRARVDDLENLVRKLQSDLSGWKRKADDNTLEAEKWKAKYDNLQKKYQGDMGILQNEVNYRKEAAKKQTNANDPEKRRERELVDDLVDSMRNRIDSLERDVDNLEYQSNESKKKEFAKGTDAGDWKNKYRLLESRAEIEGVPIPSEGVSIVKKDPRWYRYNHQSHPFENSKLPTEALENLNTGYNEEQGLNQNLNKENQFLRKDNFEKELELENWRNKYLQQQQKHAFEIDLLRKEFQLKLQQMLADNLYLDGNQPHESSLLADPNRSKSIDSKMNRSRHDPYLQSSPSQDDSQRYVSTEPQYVKTRSSGFSQSYHDPFANEVNKKSKSPSQQPNRSSRLLEPQSKQNRPQAYDPRSFDSGESSFRNPLRGQEEGSRWGTDPHESAYQQKSPYLRDPKNQFGSPIVTGNENNPRKHQGDVRDVSPGVEDASQPARRNQSSNSRSNPLKQEYSKPGTDPDQRITEDEELFGSGTNSGEDGRRYPGKKPQQERSAAPKDSNKNFPKAEVEEDEKTISAPRSEKTKQKGNDNDPDNVYQTPKSTTPNRDAGNTRASPTDSSTIIERAVRPNQAENAADRRRDTSQGSPPPLVGRKSEFRGLNSGLGKSKLSSDPFKDTDLRAIMLMIEVERLGSQVASLDQTNQDLQARERALTLDNKTLGANFGAQKKQLQDMNEKVNQLAEDADKLQKVNARLASSEKNLKSELEKYRANDSKIKEALSEKDKEHQKDRSDLEDRVKNHQVKQEELENRLLGLIQELDQTKVILGQKEKEAIDLANDKEILLEEVDDLENRLAELESKSKADLAQQKLQHEEEKNKAVRNETGKLKEEHKNELQQLQDELSSHKAKIPPLERKNKNINDELEKEKMKTKHLEDELETLRSQLASAEEQKNLSKNSLEKKLKDAANENDKKLEEIGNLKKELAELKVKMEQDGLNSNQKRRELENERAQMSLFLDRVKSKCEDLAIRLVMVMSELDRQIGVSQQKDTEISGLMQKMAALKRQHDEDVENFRKSHNEYLNSVLNKQKADHENEKERLHQDSRKFAELEKLALKKILENEFGDHVDRLQDLHHGQITQANSEIDSLRKRIKELEERLSQAEANIVNLRSENQNLDAEVGQLEAQNEESENEINDLHNKLAVMNTQLKALSQDKESLETERMRDQSKIRELMQNIDELQRRLLDAVREIDRLNKVIQDYQQKHSEAVARIQDHEQLQDQFENLKKNAVISREAEIKFEAERAGYQAKILGLEAKINHLDATNESLSKDLTNMKDSLQRNTIKFEETQKNLLNKLQDLEKMRHKYEECIEGLSSSPIKGNSKSPKPGFSWLGY